MSSLQPYSCILSFHSVNVFTIVIIYTSTRMLPCLGHYIVCLILISKKHRIWLGNMAYYEILKILELKALTNVYSKLS